MKTIRCCHAAAMLLLVLILAACGGGDTPEEQVRKFVAAGEEAVEARDIGDVKELISEKYSDDYGRTRRDLVALSARYILSNKNIHLLTRTGELSFPAEDRALLQLYVAMTGQNVSDLDSLLNIQADLYRFDLELVREDKEWKLVKGDWRPARGEDFF
ncbi:MAG: hypothetical protein M8357_04630 [Desulfobulbaceae bacterium]|nr:hypothetical protein [Desulfobulbaceae bacterium]